MLVTELGSGHRPSTIEPSDVLLQLRRSAGLHFWSVTKTFVHAKAVIVATNLTDGCTFTSYSTGIMVFSSQSLVLKTKKTPEKRRGSAPLCGHIAYSAPKMYPPHIPHFVRRRLSSSPVFLARTIARSNSTHVGADGIVARAEILNTPVCA